MICPTCQTESSHIRIETNGQMGCHACLGFSESGGTKTDKILTRNASRITEQAVQYEQDMITPYVVDKNTNKAVVNEDFINLYPNQAAQTYTKEELKSVGQPDLKPKPATKDNEGIEFKGDEKEAVDKVIKSA